MKTPSVLLVKFTVLVLLEATANKGSADPRDEFPIAEKKSDICIYK